MDDNKTKRKKYGVMLDQASVSALRERVKKAVAEAKADERLPSETSVLEAVIAKALRGGR